MSYTPQENLSITSAIGINSDTVTSGGNWSGNTYTGAGELNQYAYAGVNLQVDESGTLYFDFSQDGIIWSTFPVAGFTVISGINEVHTAWKGGRYMRPRFVGNGGRTYFRLKTFYSNLPLPLSAPLNQGISSDQDATITRSVLVGADYAGNYRNVGTDSEGHLRVNMDEPLSAFGEMLTVEPTPVAQVDFVYGLNIPQLVNTGSTSGGTITSTDGLVNVTTSAATNSSATCYSSKYLKYRDGQGVVGRLTALFTSGVTDNNQYAGVANPSMSDGFLFGYSGTTFGIIHMYSGTTRAFYPQTEWNEDVMDGSSAESNPSGQDLDPTKGNVYQIKFQYLGFGMIYFYVENGDNGELVNVHNIKYSNVNTLPSLRNASLNLVWKSENSSNNTAITVRGASGALFIEGTEKFLGPKNAIDNNKSGINTLTNIVTLKNATTYNGIANRAQIRVRTISVAYDGGNGLGIIQVHKNPTIGGSPSYTTINGTTGDGGATITNGQSIVSYDIAGTTLTANANSYILFNTSLARNNNITIDVSDLDIYANPGDILSFACKGTASGAFSVSVNWNEDI